MAIRVAFRGRRRRPPRPSSPTRPVTYQWLSRRPLVLRYGSPIGDDEATIEAFYGALPHERVHHLVTYCWHYTADQIARHDGYVRTLRPEHVLHHLVSELDVLRGLEARGLDAAFSHQNAFLDERRMTHDPGATKRFDAVYVARMNPFKRHELAREVESLLIVGGVQSRTDTTQYARELRRAMPHAAFAARRPFGRLQVEQVAALVNSARVGLCLSRVEGAMFAAGEYLLCGLPVVSTRALGGREEWLEGPYCRFVEDDPAAVRSAVAELAAAGFDPLEIRRNALARAVVHRRKFVEVVQRIYDHERAGREFAREWYPRFFHTFEQWRLPQEVMRHLDEDC